MLKLMYPQSYHLSGLPVNDTTIWIFLENADSFRQVLIYLKITIYIPQQFNILLYKYFDNS